MCPMEWVKESIIYTTSLLVIETQNESFLAPVDMSWICAFSLE